MINEAASGAGLVAASIAVFGFLAQSKPALARHADDAVRAATVAGGLFGFVLSAAVVFWAIMR